MSLQTLFQSKCTGYEWINYMYLLGPRAIFCFWEQKIIHCLSRTECMTFTKPLRLAGLGLRRWKLRADFFLADVQKTVPGLSPTAWLLGHLWLYQPQTNLRHQTLNNCHHQGLFQAFVLNKGCSQAFITVFSLLYHPAAPQNGSTETEDIWPQTLWKKSSLPKFLFIKIVEALVLCNSFAELYLLKGLSTSEKNSSRVGMSYYRFLKAHQHHNGIKEQ